MVDEQWDDQMSMIGAHTNITNKSYAELYRQRTEGQGECAFHATFGQWDERAGKIICPDVVERRKTLAKAIREVTQNQAIFPLVVKAIQEMLNSGGGSFKTLQGEYQKHLQDNAKSIDEEWNKLEKELKAYPEIYNFIITGTQNNSLLKNFKQQFQHCLNREGGTLYGLILSVESINRLFISYNNESDKGFNLEQRILQDRTILNEYAAYVERKGQWLMPYELNMIAHIFNIHIKFYSYNPYRKKYTEPEDFNPIGKSSVSVCFDGYGHFEKIAESESVSFLKLNQFQTSVDDAINSYRVITHKIDAKQIIEGEKHAKLQSEIVIEGQPDAAIEGHVKLQSEVEAFLEMLKKKLNHLESMLIEYEKNKLNSALLKSISHEYVLFESNTKKKITALEALAKQIKPPLFEYQVKNLEIILETILQNFNIIVKDDKVNLVRQLEATLLSVSLSSLKSKLTISPSCFISYAWGNNAQVNIVHRIAKDLKILGINVKLDIWDNTTGSIHAFTDLIDTQDYVIVVGSDDLMEKWQNFVSNGRSRDKTDLDYTGNVICEELRRIFYRLRNKPNNNHGIINLLLSGKHDTSFPGVLKDLPSDSTDFRNKNKYTESFFNLLAKLSPKPTDSKQREIHESYKHLLNQEFKKLSEEVQYLYTLTEEQLWDLYQKNLKNSKEIVVDLNTAIKDRLSLASFNTPESIFERQASSSIFYLPNQHSSFVGRMDLLESLYQTLHSDKNVKNAAGRTSTITAVCAGTGGVGKTQLALQYMSHPKHPYTLRIWLPADNISVLHQRYRELAKEWGLQDEKVSLEAILLYVKEWLSKHPGWLLVYDNVNNYEEIKDFLPEEGGSIILTTRYRKWPPFFKSLDIEVMAEEEAILLMKSIIKVDVEKEVQELKALVKILGYLPLALAQASAYIRENGTSISEYLKLYQQYEPTLLADKTLPEGGPTVPVAATWNISLEAIAKEALKNQEPLYSLELLSVCAYLAPDNISRDLLSTWLKAAYPNLNAPELVLDNHLGRLQRYSMINFAGKNINIHRLIQVIVRYQHQGASKKTQSQPLIQGFSISWLKSIMQAANKEFNRIIGVLEDETRRRNLLPHLQRLDEYLTPWSKELGEELGELLHNIGFVFSDKGFSKDAANYLERALVIFERHYGKEHVEVAITLNNLASAYGDLGNAKKQKELLERALVIQESDYGKEHVEVAITLGNLANAYGALGDTKKQKELLERALVIKERDYGKEHVEVARTLANLANAYGALGDAKKQKELLERALIIKERDYGKEHVEIAKIITNLGNAYGSLGDAKQQKKLLERALNIEEAHYGNEHVQVASILANLANAYGDLGDAKKKKELLERALVIKERDYGREHVEIAKILTNLGNAYGSLGDAKQQKELLERALNIEEAHYGKEHVEVAKILTNLGNAYGSLGDAKQQKKLLERALNAEEAHYGKEHVEVAKTLSNLANAYGDLGDVQKAKELLKRALVIFERHYGKEHVEVAITLNNLGSAYGALGEAKKKKELLERALLIKERHYGKEHAEIAITSYNLAATNMSLQKYDIAYSLAERSYQIFLKTFGADHKYTMMAGNLHKQSQDFLSKTSTAVPTTPLSSLSLAINQTLKLAESFKKNKAYGDDKDKDKRIVLELYGFALGLSLHDAELKKTIMPHFKTIIKEYVLEDTRQIMDVPLSNLAENLNQFNKKLKLIRSRFEKKGASAGEERVKELHQGMTELVVSLFNYIQSLLGKAPCRFTMLSLGSFASKMTTPYSDVEYVILVDTSSDSFAKAQTYFRNFCDLFDFFMISFGESALYYASPMIEAHDKEAGSLKEHLLSPHLESFKKGIRVDSHKKPQDLNRILGLINTPKGLLEGLPHKVIHEAGNHLTSALFSADLLWGEPVLQKQYQNLLMRYLSSTDYLECIKKFFNEDIKHCQGLAESLELCDLDKGSDIKAAQELFDIKTVFAASANMVKSLSLFLISTGEKIELNNNVYAMLDTLLKGGHIQAAEKESWQQLIKILFGLRLDLQRSSQSAESKITFSNLEKQLLEHKLTIESVYNTLSAISKIAGAHFEKRKDYKAAKSLAELICVNDSPAIGLPVQHCSFVGRKDLLENLYQTLHSDKNAAEHTSRITAVCAGTGGVGKTQLALQYISHPKYPYNLRIWLPADNISVLQQRYRELAKGWGLQDEKASLEAIFLYVKDWLSKHPGWLLVYDNVNNYEEIKDFLPERGGSIILTTRYRKWPPLFGSLGIEVMTEEEAILLMKSIIKKDVEKEVQELKTLAKTLGYLPLALVQASAYIRENGKSISEYLKLYQQYEPTLLADKTLPEGGPTVPVAATWNISLEAIVKEASKNQEPLHRLELLNVCAYLAPDNISRDLLLTWLKATYPNLNAPELVLDNHLGRLQRYSMINFAEKNINIHRLIQVIVRYQHQGASKKTQSQPLIPGFSISWLKSIMQAANKEFNRTIGVLEDEARKRNLLPHLQSLDEYSTPWSKELGEELGELLHNIGFVFLDKGLSENAANYSERALVIFERHYGKEHVEVAITLNNLASAYGDLGNAKKQKELLERALVIFERDYDKEHSEIAIILGNLANACGALGDTQKQKELLERSLVIQERHYSKEHVEIASTLNNLSNAYGDLGDTKKQKELLERALRIEEGHYGKKHVEVAKILVNLGNVYGKLGDAQRKKELLERALVIFEHDYGKEHVEVAKTLNNLGSAYGALGDTKKQKELLERALVIKERHYGKEHAAVVSTLNNLANAYGALGDAHKKKELLVRALVIEERHYGKEHVEVTSILNDLANAYGTLGDAQKKKELLERALLIKERHYGKEHIEVAGTLGNLGSAYGALGDTQEAKKLLERALVIQERKYGDEHTEVAIILGNLGSAYGALGEAKKQKEVLERALVIFERHYGTEHVDVAITLVNLANTYGVLGDTQKKKELLERALVIEERHYSKEHVEVAKTLGDLANAYGALGEAKKQKELLERVLVIFERHYGKEHVEVAGTLGNLAATNISLQRYDIAYSLAEKSHQIFLRTFGAGHKYTVMADNLLKQSQAFLSKTSTSAVPVLTFSHQSGNEPTELQKILLRLKISKDKDLPSAEIALRRAAAVGSKAEAEFLIKHVKDINNQDDNPTSKKTALHWAAKNKHEDVFDFLISQGAKADIKDAEGKTAEDYRKLLPSVKK